MGPQAILSRLLLLLRLLLPLLPLLRRLALCQRRPLPLWPRRLLLCLLRLLWSPVGQLGEEVLRLGIRNHHAPLLGIAAGRQGAAGCLADMYALPVHLQLLPG